ncbi:hypothetical protein X992_3746 [Burkholderia pseudomallei MSHR5492]|nr:hypothetical protein X992_3746 [Burkholderia pseudomallei MSHR5492]KGX64425.1 hypothetical protein Y025_2081 [Burkholderia pseudomallei TSV32]
MPGIRRSAPAPRHLRLTPTVFRCRATIDAALLSRPMGNLAAVTVAAAAPRCSYGGNRRPQPNRPMKDGNRQADKPTSDE